MTLELTQGRISSQSHPKTLFGLVRGSGNIGDIGDVCPAHHFWLPHVCNWKERTAKRAFKDCVQVLVNKLVYCHALASNGQEALDARNLTCNKQADQQENEWKSSFVQFRSKVPHLSLWTTCIPNLNNKMPRWEWPHPWDDYLGNWVTHKSLATFWLRTVTYNLRFGLFSYNLRFGLFSHDLWLGVHMGKPYFWDYSST